MMRTGLAIATAALAGSTAFAADLPQRTAPMAPVLAAPAILPWNGAFSGTGIGYMWMRATSREPAARGRYDLDGTTGVSFVGRDWQFGSFVLGVQGEIAFHETKGSMAPGPTTGASGDHLWTGGVKGRVGYAFGSVLPFASAGVSTTEFHQHSALLFQDGDVRQHTGFTLGAGVDIAWTQRFVTRLEYEYANYGGANYVHDGVNHRVDLEGHAVRVAAIVRETPGSGSGGTLAPGRSGPYAGVLVGYGFTDSSFRRPVGTRTNVDLDGTEVGLFGGYDLGLGSWFIGYDTNVTASGIEGQATGAAGPIEIDTLWSGNTRARLGASMGAFSPYIAGGFALAQFSVRSVATDALDVMMAYGGTGAVGFDYALTDRWFARAEYAYTRYAAVRPRVDFVANRLELDRHDIRVGLGYRLGD